MTPVNHPYDVSIVIPTYKRPESLARAIQSVMTQQQLNKTRVEVLIVDNDPAASARETVHRFDNAIFDIRYEHEPMAGVANARNRAVDCVKSQLIAFLDDDQSAPDIWLASLLAVYQEHNTAVTFGPVKTALPRENMEHEHYLQHFFARFGPENSGLIDEYFGCGNCLMDLKQMGTISPLFNTDRNETGGEDDYLFSQLEDAGLAFGWAANASVFEHVPESRTRLRYTLRRAFSYGQGPTSTAWHKETPNIPMVLFWMTVGVGQFFVFGALSLAMKIKGHKNRAYWYDRTIRGLGKVCWFGPFNQRFYGQYAS